MKINPSPHTDIPATTHADEPQPLMQDRSPEADAAPSVRKKRGVAETQHLWPQNSTVRVSFSDLSEEQKELTKAAILKWQPYINLKIEFVDTNDADIRITWQMRPGGSSLMGTQAKTAPSDEPTMRICYAADDAEVSRVAMHEFGHALGIRHEHLHPDNPTQYDVPALTKIWGEEFANKEFGSPYKGIAGSIRIVMGNIKTTAYDPQSVMHYYLGSREEKGSELEGPNFSLSPGDKYLAEALYPPEHKHVFMSYNSRTGRKYAFEWDPGAVQTPQAPGKSPDTDGEQDPLPD